MCAFPRAFPHPPGCLRPGSLHAPQHRGAHVCADHGPRLRSQIRSRPTSLRAYSCNTVCSVPSDRPRHHAHNMLRRPVLHRRRPLGLCSPSLRTRCLSHATSRRGRRPRRRSGGRLAGTALAAEAEGARKGRRRERHGQARAHDRPSGRLAHPRDGRPRDRRLAVPWKSRRHRTTALSSTSSLSSSRHVHVAHVRRVVRYRHAAASRRPSGAHMFASMASCSACVLAPLMLSICLPSFHCSRGTAWGEGKMGGMGGLREGGARARAVLPLRGRPRTTTGHAACHEGAEM